MSKSLNDLSSKFFPKKSFGQNFLINTGIQQKIIDSCRLKPDDEVLEIGPGKGALTIRLVPYVKSITAVEKDKTLAAYLEKEIKDGKVTICCEDFLDYDLGKSPMVNKIIGNLPYNAATPIIEKILLDGKNVTDIFIMVQLEHGQRMVAGPGTKDYGSLSVFVQMYADPKILFKISPGSFFPAPKVQSCFMQLKKLPSPRFDLDNDEAFFQLVRQGFSQRRKICVNALKTLVGEDETEAIFKNLKIDARARAEDIAVKQWVDFYRQLKKKDFTGGCSSP